jgi:hypothetical protein
MGYRLWASEMSTPYISGLGLCRGLAPRARSAAPVKVRKQPASWGAPGRRQFSSSQISKPQKPAAAPIKLAISTIFQVVVISPLDFYTNGVLGWFSDVVLKVAIEP